MMKRMRTIDVPKFRRAVKNRAKLGESVSLNSSGLVYVKLFMIWLSCVALDLAIGFRFELLWPVWLMIRHLYDAFRVQTFASSFHYSAFSVFFVCITATSDLICYLFIPVQVLLFLASTYVWIQFVYQSTDRGFCTPSLLLWSTFVGFEYLIRCRFDQSTWYLTRSSWVTAGMFSSHADNIQLGGPAAERLDVYRPFAAHCLGYPIVTLGFRVKSYFSSWRLRRRRMDVQRQNEFFNRLLADAVPKPYECRFHLSSAKQQLALEHDQAEYELEEEDLPGAVASAAPSAHSPSASGGPKPPHLVTTQPTAFGLYSATPGQPPHNGPLAAHFPPSHAVARKSRPASAAKLAANGNGVPLARNGALRRRKDAPDQLAAGPANGAADDDQRAAARKPSITLLGLPHMFYTLLCMLLNVVVSHVLGPAWQSLTRPEELDKPHEESALGNDPPAAYEAYDSDKDNNKENVDKAQKRSNRLKRRGRTPQNQYTTASPTRSPRSSRQQSSSRPKASEENGACERTTSSRNGDPMVSSGHLPSLIQYTCIAPGPAKWASPRSSEERSRERELCDGGASRRVDELKEQLRQLRTECEDAKGTAEHLASEKEIMEKALEGIRAEMQQLRNSETGLKAELLIAQQQDRNARKELQQLRQRLSEAEQRTDATNRQLDQQRQQLQQQHAKQKKDKASIHAERAAVLDQQKEISELKAQLQRAERDCQDALLEVKSQRAAAAKLEQRLKTVAESGKTERANENGEGQQRQVQEMKQAIARLEKTLMSENRLKVDLFRALNDSKSQIETLTQQLRTMELERIQNGFAPSLKSEFMHAQLPSSLVATLAQKPLEDGSTNSSSSPTISPASSSPAAQQTKLALCGADRSELERLFHGNGSFNIFPQDPSFSPCATPAAPAAPFRSPASRCNSPSSSELFNILNGAPAVPLGFGNYLNGKSASGVNGNSSPPSYH